MVGALVDIEHLSAILSLAYIKHLAASDGPSAVEVILVPDLLHLQHVLAADGLVAALVEDD